MKTEKKAREEGEEGGRGPGGSGRGPGTWEAGWQQEMVQFGPLGVGLGSPSVKPRMGSGIQSLPTHEVRCISEHLGCSPGTSWRPEHPGRGSDPTPPPPCKMSSPVSTSPRESPKPASRTQLCPVFMAPSVSLWRSLSPLFPSTTPHPVRPYHSGAIGTEGVWPPETGPPRMWAGRASPALGFLGRQGSWLHGVCVGGWLPT